MLQETGLIVLLFLACALFGKQLFFRIRSPTPPSSPLPKKTFLGRVDAYCHKRPDRGEQLLADRGRVWTYRCQ